MMTASASAPNRTTALPDGSVRFVTAGTPRPVVVLLSNGPDQVMITAAGGLVIARGGTWM